MKIPVYNIQGEEVGSYDIADELLSEKINYGLLHQAVVAHLANCRQGTHATKTRGRVAGSGRKPWRQKGTGRARHGSTRAPQWRGGGIVHGPQPVNHNQKLNKKMRRLAIKHAWIVKLKERRVVLLDRLELEQPKAKTKRMVEILNALGIGGEKVLLLLDKWDEVLERSCRNLPNFASLPCLQPSAYDLLNAGCVLTTVRALELVKGRWWA